MTQLIPIDLEANFFSKSKGHIVIIFSVISLVLYLLSAIFYVILKYSSSEGIIVTLTIFEIGINVLSLVLCIIATVQCDKTIHRCIAQIKKINVENESLLSDEEIGSHMDGLKKSDYIVNTVYIVYAAIFLIYSICCISYLLSNNTAVLDYMSIFSGAISALLSIVLGIVTVISNSKVGQHINFMLTTTANYNRKIVDKYNDLIIKNSYLNP